MPSRKSARLAAAKGLEQVVSEALNPPQVHPARTAANTAFAIPEVLDRIIFYLDNTSIARLMRTEKAAVSAPARKLYKTTDWSRICKFIYRSKDWHKSIYAAITIIDVRKPWMLVSMRNDLGVRPDQSLAQFDPEVIDQLATHRPGHGTLTSGLKSRCPNLRSIWLGTAYTLAPFQGECWAIHFPRTPKPDLLSPSSSEAGTVASDAPLEITIIRSVTESLRALPPTSLVPSYPPSPNYTVTNRFNLHLDNPTHAWDNPPRFFDEWLAAIQTNPQFGNLFDVVELSDVKVTLPDITALYNLQIKAGHAHRLSCITAGSLTAWTIEEFDTFSRVASRSLTNLHIGAYLMTTKLGDTTHDLSAIKGMIRHRLPNLQQLTFFITDIRLAEGICGEHLHSQTLRHGGSVRRLRIRMNGQPDDLFNIIRCLYGLCTPDVDFAMTWYSYVPGEEDWSITAQQTFLKYLQKQRSSRRKHLGNVDFGKLDIYTPDQVSNLRYHPDGRPQRLYETKAAMWSNKAKAALESTASTLFPNLTAGLLDLSQKSDRVQATMLAGKTGPEAHEEAMELVRAVGVAQKAIDQVSKILPADLGRQVEKYAKLLKGEEEQPSALFYAWQAFAAQQDVGSGSDSDSS